MQGCSGFQVDALSNVLAAEAHTDAQDTGRKGGVKGLPTEGTEHGKMSDKGDTTGNNQADA